MKLFMTGQEKDDLLI